MLVFCPNKPVPVVFVPNPPNAGRGVPKADVLPPNNEPELCVEGVVLPNNPPVDDVAPKPKYLQNQ